MYEDIGSQTNNSVYNCPCSSITSTIVTKGIELQMLPAIYLKRSWEFLRIDQVSVYHQHIK